MSVQRSPGATNDALRAPGTLYSVAGVSIHLVQTGGGNLPCVLIEAGNSMSAMAYWRIQSELSRSLRVITYDRAGLGWSDDIPGRRDAGQVCDQLHELLGEAGVKSPLVLVGHSIGGLFLRIYAGKYPSEVAGVVFLDATHPRAGEMFEDDDQITRVLDFYRAQKACVLSGRLHASDHAFIERFKDIPHVQEQLRYAASQPRRYDVAAETTRALETSFAQAQSYGDLGDLPVTAISARTKIGADWRPRFDEDRINAFRLELHRELGMLSSRGKLVEIPDADHGSLISEPPFAAQVAAEILRTAEQTRRRRL
jgi:pimeloyl-ACP methyl ester carboxylesterase